MNPEPSIRFPQPPRLLLGVTVVVWGGLTGNAIAALLAAMLIEARYWVSWRWRFGQQGYARAWFLSIVILGGSVAYHSLNSTGPAALLHFLGWLPLIFLPLVLTQQYGESPALPSTVFSVWARLRQKQDEKVGRIRDEHFVHIGYPYFAFTLLSAGYSATGEREQWTYFVVLALLAGIGIYYAHRSEQRRLLPWFVVVALTSSISYAGSRGLLDLYEWIKNRNYLQVQGREPLEEQNTAIGRLGQLKLDRRLQWRLSVPKGDPVPARLMTKAYNFYRQGKWQARDSEYQNYEGAFSDLLRATEDENEGEFAFAAAGFSYNDQQDAQQQPRQLPMRIRGAVSINRKPFPATDGLQLIADATEVDAIELSELGTLLAINADGVIDLELWTSPEMSLREAPPRQRIRNEQLEGLTELALPDASQSQGDEAAIFREIATELKLFEMDDRTKIEKIRSYFFSNFKYTTHLKSGSVPYRSPVTTFLQETKEGHCEYFATSAALLLRAAGVPSRYAVGFAVNERAEEPGEYLLRGTHAHAWCRAYIGGTKTIVPEQRVLTRNGGEINVTLQREVWEGGQWVDVDVTPPSWLMLDSPPPTFRERIADNLQQWREDFQVWRSDESNRGWINLVLAIVAIAVLVFVIWRLSGSRLRKEIPSQRQILGRPERTTPLLDALPQLESHFGKRSFGKPLSRWLPEKLECTPAVRNQFALRDCDRMLVLHERQRFGSNEISNHDFHELDTLVAQLLRTCAQSKST